MESKNMTKRLIWSNYIFQFLLGYETQKVVLIRNKPVGIVYRIVQLSIFVYVALWAMWWERGYQTYDTITSGTSVKIFGLPISNINYINKTDKSKVWDIADIIVPPQQNSGFFITTKLIVTPDQTQSFCTEAKSVKISSCRNDSDCVKGFMINTMHGPFTGTCLKNVNRCEIFGWCPVEEDLVQSTSTATSMLKEVIDYTVLISNTVKFRRYGIKRRNILPYMTSGYLKTCRYHPKLDPLCPVFRIGDIFKNSQTNLKHILENGGIIAISIDWTCDFDRSIEKCVPQYSFTRLYNDQEDSNINDDDDARNAGLANGWNIRYSNQYENDGVKHRILTKAIGVQFFIHTTGRGWRFDFATFTMNCGSGLALFGGATFFCDMILLYFLKKRKVYRIAKCDILESSSQQ